MLLLSFARSTEHCPWRSAAAAATSWCWNSGDTTSNLESQVGLASTSTLSTSPVASLEGTTKSLEHGQAWQAAPKILIQKTSMKPEPNPNNKDKNQAQKLFWGWSLQKDKITQLLTWGTHGPTFVRQHFGLLGLVLCQRRIRRGSEQKKLGHVVAWKICIY